MEPQLTKTVSPAQASIGGIVAFTITAEFDWPAAPNRRIILDDYYGGPGLAFLSASVDLPQEDIADQPIKPQINGHSYKYIIELRQPLHKQPQGQNREHCQMTLSVLMAVLPGLLPGISRSQARLVSPKRAKTPFLAVPVLPNPLFISSDKQKAVTGASLTYTLTFMNHTSEPISDLLLALSPGIPSFSFLAGNMFYDGNEAVVLSKNRENSDSASLSTADLQAETGFFTVPWTIAPHRAMALILVYQIGSQVARGLYSSTAWAEYTQAVPISHLIITSAAAAEVEVSSHLAGSAGTLRLLH